MSTQSSCIACCALNDDHVCVGCYRSIYEIANWNRLSDDDKAAVNADLPARKAAMPAWGSEQTKPITGDLHRAAKAEFLRKNKQS
ncbi:DUF1289 domain-containing protein [Gallaecimonas sp. GXIMD4217]|uniref:DUF1289 domain-containing protein n=1 Tax=Gallaecimonas sp. GXIMD4217 TaxID=3131927 RepID=UPI00311AC933